MTVPFFHRQRSVLLTGNGFLVALNISEFHAVQVPGPAICGCQAAADNDQYFSQAYGFLVALNISGVHAVQVPGPTVRGCQAAADNDQYFSQACGFLVALNIV